MAELHMFAGGTTVEDRLVPDAAWWVRPAHSSRGRQALEIYHGDRLLDVMVEGALAPEVLRGAVRGEPAEPVLAWGLLAAEDGVPEVRFGRESAAAEVRVVADVFWVALGPADADRVTVLAHPGAEPEGLRVGRPR
ncbi:hypothetical protein [Streptacidiphilus fuscans]|uniref:Uncharacterized protein n=1 Tax=Streptacidiphilus fuscans TaxID=2789292 RepID=A0A931B6N0_9ACTN|nr:hypothetical protein [Streptacidiphilus fuscans]MBF9069627.1 hypothetical protein [Streptacidiphilus fuscans]